MSTSNETRYKLIEVSKIAPTNWRAALKVARLIDDTIPYANSMSVVIRSADSSDIVSLANESTTKIHKDTDIYRRVTGSICPVRALMHRNKSDHAEHLFDRLIRESNEILHPVNRMDALAELYVVSKCFSPSTRKHTLKLLVVACQAANSWRSGRLMAYVAREIAEIDVTWAEEVVAVMPSSRYKRIAENAIRES